MQTFSVVKQLDISENVCLYLFYYIILLALNQFLAAVSIPRASGPVREFRALREYSHALRLASELADLRAANANPCGNAALRLAAAAIPRASAPIREQGCICIPALLLVTRTGLEPMLLP